MLEVIVAMVLFLGITGAIWGLMQVGLQGSSFVQQTLSLTAGNYTLAWSDAGRLGYGAAQYQVSYGAQPLGTFNTAPGQAWASHSVPFLASGSEVLKFQGVGVSGDGTAFIDNVTVSAVTVVPEPTTALLMAGGLAVVSLLRRRRRG